MRVEVYFRNDQMAILEEGVDPLRYKLEDAGGIRPNGQPIFEVRQLGGGERHFDLQWWYRVNPSKSVLRDLRRVLPTIHAYRQSYVVLRPRDLVYLHLAAE